MACALFLAAAIVPAQEPPQPTFRTRVTLVRISVVVKDQKGKLIVNLARGDFQIFDNDRPQPIRLFLSEKDNSKPSRSEPKAANTFTNQIAASAELHSGYSVILIDSIFTDWGDVRRPGSANARVSALRALRSIPAGEKIAIYATARQLQVICEFTWPLLRLQRLCPVRRTM